LHQNLPIKPVFVDEFGTHLSMSPTRARTLKGQRAIERVPRNRGQNVSVVAAMTSAGIQVPMMLNGSLDAAAFEAWVGQALIPVLSPGMVVFMDNVRFHLKARVRDLIEGAGCVLSYLPAYSPDLNAIEEGISKIKTGLRRLKPRDVKALRVALVEVLASVSVADVRGWVEHAGYRLSA
jgi:transposase